MLFLLATINEGNFRAFAFTASTLEKGLDSISRIALSCERLVSIQLQENDSMIHLPPQAFDGHPISGPMKQLEQQWQEALSCPTTDSTAERTDQIDWYSYQINQLRTTTTDLERMINVLYQNSRWLQTAVINDASRVRLLSSNERSIGHYQRCLAIAQRQLSRHIARVSTTNNP